MSETLKWKRLTDEQWSLKWGASMPDRRAPVLVELRDDHHQAREHVRRLAERLRNAVETCCPQEGEDREDPPCPTCTDDLALLAEVST